MDQSLSADQPEYKVSTDTLSTYSWDEGLESDLAYDIHVSMPSELPLRLVDRRHEIVDTQRGGLRFRNRYDGSVSSEPPKDLHLHELVDLDVDDVDAVIAFCNEFGLLWLPKGVIESHEVPGVQSAVASWDHPPSWRSVEPVIDVREVQLALRLLRATTASWVAYQANTKLDAAWVDESLQQPIGDDQAMRWMLAIINPGLVSAYPSLVLTRAGENAQSLETGLGINHGISLYDAICVRIYNDVVTHRPYNYCENELCRRAFLTKRDPLERSKTRTSGVRFCSDVCKRRQDSREYRRRKNQESK